MAKPIKQSVPINFSGGLDLKADPWQVGPANFLSLNNMVFSEGGRLTKRNGFASLSTTVTTPSPALTHSAVGSNITSARKVFSYNDELLVADGFNLFSRDTAGSTWRYKGRLTNVDVATQSIAQGNTTYVNVDSCVDTTNNLRIIAYSGQGAVDLKYSVQDIDTGQFIINQSVFGSTSDLYEYPRCISIAGTSYIFAIKFSDNTVYYQKIVGSTVTGSVTALVTLNATYQWYDIDVDTFSGNIYLAYLDASGTPRVTISAVSSSMVIGNTISVAATATNGVSWFGDGSNIWVVYATATVVSAFAVNNAVTLTTGTAAVIDNAATAAAVSNVTGVWSTTQNKAFIFYDPTTFSSSLVATSAINYNTATISGGAVTPGTASIFVGSVNLNSKAFTVSGIPHVVGLYDYVSSIPNAATPTILTTVAIQATNFLFNLYNITSSMGGSNNQDVPANIAAKVFPGASTTLPPNGAQRVATNPVGGALPRVQQSSSGVWELGMLNNSNFAFTSATADGFSSPVGASICEFDFNLTNPDVQVLGKNALVAGGQVTMYDGASVCEQNFHIYPNSAAATEATPGGSLGSASEATLYSYIYLYEWIDNEGQVHRSFPSPVVTPLDGSNAYTFAPGTTNGQVTLTIPTLRVTNKSGSQVVINIYRTIGNGSVYFLLGSSFLNSYGTVTNNPAVNSVTYVDSGTSDAQLQGNPQLYTTGSLGYYAPPATNALTNFKNRAIQVSSEDPFQIGYSNAVLPNFPVQFVPEFLQNIGTIGGPLTAVAQMDDKMIIFKDGKSAGPPIHYMQGQGPAPSGAGNDFRDPLPIAIDVGCVDRSSIVLTPVGLMFKSDKGIYLLDRGLNGTYIGAPVEFYNQYSVVSAQLIPNTTQVRFLLSSGTLLMYDYFYKVWATFSNPAGVSDCIFQGQHTYVSSSGVVYKETPGVYIDGSATPILMSFTTSWIKLAGLQGYQRAYFFYLLAEYISGHQISLDLYTNFSTTPDQTTVITPDATNALENWRVFFAKQRCQSFQIALTEVYTGTLGAAFSLSGLNLIVGAKSSFRTIPSAQSTG